MYKLLSRSQSVVNTIDLKSRQKKLRQKSRKNINKGSGDNNGHNRDNADNENDDGEISTDEEYNDNVDDTKSIDNDDCNSEEKEMHMICIAPTVERRIVEIQDMDKIGHQNKKPM